MNLSNLLTVIVGVIIAMALVAMAPYIIGGAVLIFVGYLVCRTAEKEPKGMDTVTVKAREVSPPEPIISQTVDNPWNRNHRR